MEQRSRLQNLWLIGLAVMAAVFFVLLQIISSQEGVLFHDALLRVEETDKTRVYSGRSHGADVRIEACRTGTKETVLHVDIENGVKRSYLVEYPLEQVQTEHGLKPGLRISRDGEVLFTGACDPEAYHDSLGYLLYNEHGVWDVNFDIVFQTEVNYGGGYWEHYEMDVSTMLDFALGSQLKARGDGEIFFYGLLLTSLAAVLVAFPNTLFHWDHRWYVKDPEPTEFYFTMNKVAGGVITALALIAYILALRNIP